MANGPAPVKRPIAPIADQIKAFEKFQSQMQPGATYSWETAPTAIPESDIKEVLDTDVCVLGCGLGGCAATLSVAQTGVKVLQLEKSESFNARGRGNFGYNSRVRPALGDEYPNPTPKQIAERKNTIVKEIMEFGGYRGEQRIANFLVDNSGEAQNWILDVAEEMGVEVEVRKYGAATLSTGEYQEAVNLSGNRQFHYDMIFQPEGQLTLVKMLVDKLRTMDNVEQRFETPAVQLISDAEKGVVGVVAQNKDGAYIKINCQAVILATGGYEWDGEMMEKYGGPGKYIMSSSMENHCNTGDGHKMGMWVGAQIDEGPHCMLFEDGGGYHLYTEKLYGIGFTRKPWLAVNFEGERTDNEDKVWPMLGGSDALKPFHYKWVVFDDAWRDDAKVEKMGSAHSYYSLFHGYTPELTEKKIKDGDVLSADTIEELAGKMGLDPKVLQATVDRYNWNCDQGYDHDFNKPSQFLKPIRRAPFYAAKMGAALLATLGGLKINTRMQILDKEWNPIPGLYGTGNVTGGLFFNDYPENIPGLTHGRCVTFGYHAGKNAVIDRVKNEG
jgi:Succinate dehydrogenase/fumarate reductase, flavoprotein subunit